jgi:hypothetical protein
MMGDFKVRCVGIGIQYGSAKTSQSYKTETKE